jgi:hypothetical protein
MKKFCALIGLLLITSAYCYGQDNVVTGTKTKEIGSWNNSVYLGMKVGANYSNVYDTDGDSFQTDAKFGLAAGLFVEIPITKYFGVQPELLFSQKGFKAEGNLLGSTYTVTRTSNFIDLPLLVAIKPSQVLTVLVGPQYSFLLSQNNKFDNGTTSIDQEEEFDNENLRKNTLCFTGGIDINLDKMVVSARAGWDLFKNNGDGSTTTPQYKNVWTQLTLGFRL